MSESHTLSPEQVQNLEEALQDLYKNTFKNGLETVIEERIRETNALAELLSIDLAGLNPHGIVRAINNGIREADTAGKFGNNRADYIPAMMVYNALAALL